MHSYIRISFQDGSNFNIKVIVTWNFNVHLISGYLTQIRPNNLSQAFVDEACHAKQRIHRFT